MVERKQGNTLVVTKRNESDFHYAIRISIYLLKPIGSWPLASDETSRLKITLHRASMLIGTFLLLFMIVPWIVHIVKEKLDIFQIFRTACPLLFTMSCFAKYVLLVGHQDRLRFCLDIMADDWQHAIPEDRDIMLANARIGRTFGITSFTFMFSCGALYYAIPIATPNLINENNVTVRLHPSPCEFLVFDRQADPAYEIVYFLQLLSGYIAYSVFSGICSLMGNFVTHVCGQCDVLALIFEEIVHGGKRNGGCIENRIATAIIRHSRVLRLVSHVSSLFIEICLVEFVNASCNICLIGAYIVIDMNNGSSVQLFMFIFALISIIFNIYMFCYIGDMLTEYCRQLGTTCYTMEWYRIPPKRMIDLLMPMAMSQYPAMLTAGKMIPMTLTTFSDILKMSMAYFNLLREFSSRNVMRA